MLAYIIHFFSFLVFSCFVWQVTKCKYNIHLVSNGDIKHLCDDTCFKVFKANPKFIKQQQQQQKEESKVEKRELGIDRITCDNCKKKMPLVGALKIHVGSQNKLFCSPPCKDKFKKEQCCHQCLQASCRRWLA